jgi:hypothetical protein
MSKSKLIFSIVFIIGLGGLSLYLNKDRFAKESIQISHRLSPWMENRRGGRGNDLGMPVTFMLNGFYKLKSVRVVDATAFETNKFTLPVWRLISDSNSIPVSSFNYGSFIKGLRPETKGLRPEPLQAGTTYRMLVETDTKMAAQHDFTIPVAQ